MLFYATLIDVPPTALISVTDPELIAGTRLGVKVTSPLYPRVSIFPSLSVADPTFSEVIS